MRTRESKMQDIVNAAADLIELKPFEVSGCLECLRAPYTVAAAALKAVGR